MKFLSKNESIELINCIDKNIDPKDHSTLLKDTYSHISLKYPPVDALNYLSYQLAFSSHFSPWTLALLTDWSIFPNYENTHLYSLLRKTNFNTDHISDSPGHLFLNHENHELFSLINICVINSYDLLVLSIHDYSRFKLSHDGFVDIYTNDNELIESMNKFKNDRKI